MAERIRDQDTIGRTTRRAALGMGALSLVTAGCAMAPARPAVAGPAQGRREPVRFDDPIWNREAAARLQADTTGEQVYGHATGVVTGVVPGEAVRTLFNFEVFSTIRVLRQSDGSYQRMTKEVIVYLDPATGEVLNEWDNPYTNERVRVVHVANDPYNWVISATRQPPPIPGVASTGQNVPGGAPYLLHWSEFATDTIVLSEDFHGYYPALLTPEKWPRESPGRMNQSSEMFRYFIRREDLENPALTHVPHNGSWIRIQPWLPWLLMGQSPGHILYNGIFHPARSTDYASKPVLDWVKANHPDYLEAPKEWYGPSLSSLEHYALEQTPAPVK